MLKAIICVGCSGSGKSTFAEEKCRKDKSWVNINRDSLRFMLTGAMGWKDYKFNKHTENMITEVQQSMIDKAKLFNRNVIISDTNLNPNTRKKWIEYLKWKGYKVEIKEFPIDYMEAIKRDQYRTNSVGYQVINKQWQQWLDYIGHEKYVPNEDMPEAIIVDVDGTLAEMVDRKPYDWDKVDQDKCVEVIRDMVEGYNQLGYNIIILSGRDGSCESKTRNWLIENMITFDEFHIRTAGDNRPDYIIKKELFDEISPRYNIKAVVDDRPVVCRMWMDLGLKVINVGNPYQEF